MTRIIQDEPPIARFMAEPVGASYSLVLQKGADPATLGGVAVCGLTTVGSVGVIAAAHLIKSMNLNPMGTVINPDFPAVALIQESVPKHPVRVYQGDEFGVFISEIQFPQSSDVQFSNTILEWFHGGGFDRLVIIDGLVSEDLGLKEDGEIWGVSSLQRGRDALDKAGIQRIQQGIVTGVSGFLLAEGERQNLDVTVLLAECNPAYPDARAALIAVEALCDLMNIEIPVQTLLDEAREIENRVREVFERAQASALPAPSDKPDDDEISMVY